MNVLQRHERQYSCADRQAVVDVAIVGAGIIGVACAYTLARSGLCVLLLDWQEPGQGV
ncbi:MAG: FAD-dependent oxidoreductase [Herbaspirillum sp.]